MTPTTINRSWLLKMAIFVIALAGLGVWGVVDALIVFPSRGRDSAEWTELKYLEKCDQAGLLPQASTPRPREEYTRLGAEKPKIERQRDEATARSQPAQVARAEAELLRLEWLTALERVGQMTEARSLFPDARARLRELAAKWDQKNPPKALAAYDIPMQWIFVIGGFGFAGYILVLILSVGRKVYKWEPEQLALTLPDGRRLTPADVKEVDKRKWDKFYAFMKPKDGSPEVKLDLLRYKGLEEWVLEFEKKTEGYEPPPPEEPAADTGIPEGEKAEPSRTS